MKALLERCGNFCSPRWTLPKIDQQSVASLVQRVQSFFQDQFRTKVYWAVRMEDSDRGTQWQIYSQDASGKAETENMTYSQLDSRWFSAFYRRAFLVLPGHGWDMPLVRKNTKTEYKDGENVRAYEATNLETREGKPIEPLEKPKGLPQAYKEINRYEMVVTSTKTARISLLISMAIAAWVYPTRFFDWIPTWIRVGTPTLVASGVFLAGLNVEDRKRD